MVTKLRDSRAVRAEYGRDESSGVREGERHGLYAAIEAAGPVTLFGLASQAMIPATFAQRWLAMQVQGGYLVRDVSTGRYRTWCELPGDMEARS